MNRILAYSASKGEEWTNNVGDYVQGLAANQFMQTTEWIEREQMHVYDGPSSKVIMNGWFMSEPSHFPPSDRVEPLFVSFHINPQIAEAMLTPATVAYLRNHAPIGCRDEETVEILRQHGVAAYFSACLTLTLGQSYKRPEIKDCEGVCFVDPFIAFKSKNVVRGFHWFLLHPIMCFIVYRAMRKQMLCGQPFTYRLRNVLRIGVFLRSFSKLFTKTALLKGEYVSQIVNANRFKSHKEAADYADVMLKHYASRRLCVTSRIHCGLPCLAMGVPVIFVNDEDNAISAGRFSGLLRFFNVAIAHPDGLEPRFEFSNEDSSALIGERTHIPVRILHLEYAAALAMKCREFARATL